MTTKVPSIIVFGATGQTGRAVLYTALELGVKVTAFVRNPDKLSLDLRNKVEIVTGNVMDKESVSNAIKGHGAVISCLGTGTNLGSTTVMSQGCENITNAMRQHGVRKLALVVTSIYFSWLRYVLPFGSITDHLRVIKYLQQQDDIDWVALMPPFIKDSKTVGDYLVAIDKLPGSNSITTHECADFLVKSVTDEATMDKYRRGLVGISSTPSSGSSKLPVLVVGLLFGATLWWYFK